MGHDTHASIHLFIYIYRDVNIYIYIYAYIYVCTCMNACSCACMHTYIHPCMHACMHACITACMHACIHTHTHIHACIHTALYILGPLLDDKGVHRLMIPANCSLLKPVSLSPRFQPRRLLHEKDHVIKAIPQALGQVDILSGSSGFGLKIRVYGLAI